MKASILLFVAALAAAAPADDKSKIPPGTLPDSDNGYMGVQWPKEPPVPQGEKSQGCFKSKGDGWKSYQIEGLSSGECGRLCREDKKTLVAALSGEDCWCGDTYPVRDDIVDDADCNFPCPGYGPEACGGIDPEYYSVFNSGNKISVPYKEAASKDKSSSAEPAPTASKPSTGTDAATTPADSAAAASSEAAGGDDKEEEGKEGGSNVGPIVGGVVAGVAIIGLLIGGGVWWMRRRRNQEIEEEHRRNMAVNSFISGAKPPGSSGGLSMTDSRMDPVLAHRRMSDGSIADNHDYSRKILRVTNA